MAALDAMTIRLHLRAMRVLEVVEDLPERLVVAVVAISSAWPTAFDPEPTTSPAFCSSARDTRRRSRRNPDCWHDYQRSVRGPASPDFAKNQRPPFVRSVRRSRTEQPPNGAWPMQSQWPAPMAIRGPRSAPCSGPQAKRPASGTCKRPRQHRAIIRAGRGRSRAPLIRREVGAVLGRPRTPTPHLAKL